MPDRTDMAGTLVYLCYGSDAVYQQTIFSILSARIAAGGSAIGVRVAIYCDQPDRFGNLDVETVAIDQLQLDAWLAGSDYIHRRKTCTILDAIDRFGGAIAFVDSDTWFKRPAARLFDRIGPGSACFHICEGFIDATGTPFDAALARQLRAFEYQDRTGRGIAFPARMRMWNTGIVGVHADHAERVREGLWLSDQIWRDADPAGAYGAKIHHAEQFAMGHVLDGLRLREGADIVYHYWPKPMKVAFSQALAAYFAARGPDRVEADIDPLFAQRPRESGRRAAADAIKMTIRHAAMTIGVAVPGVRRSVR